jgi:hypothetical protein
LREDILDFIKTNLLYDKVDYSKSYQKRVYSYCILVEGLRDEKNTSESFLKKENIITILKRIIYHFQKQITRPYYDSISSDRPNTFQEFQYLERIMLIRVLSELGEHPEISQIIMREENGSYMEMIIALLLSKDKYISVETIDFISVLFDHYRFPELFFEKDGLKALFKIPNDAFFQYGVSNIIQNTATKPTLMEQLSVHSLYVEKIMDLGFSYLESTDVYVQEMGLLFFEKIFSYKPFLMRFEKLKGINKLLGKN